MAAIRIATITFLLFGAALTPGVWSPGTAEAGPTCLDCQSP